MEFSGCLNDEAMGPAVEGCRGNFDFTIKFERIFFMLVPTTIFITVCIPRILYLIHRPVVVYGGKLIQVTKLVIIAVFGFLQLALLVLSIVRARRLEAFLISTSAITLMSTLCISVLSYLEHSRSPRPPIVLNAYLFLTILLDITQTRTLWLASASPDEITFARMFTTAVVVKVLIIILESQQKTRWLRWDTKEHSPEETSGLYSLGAFAWLNRLFLRGYTKVLTVEDLYPLDQSLASNVLQFKLSSFMDKTPRNRKHGLAKATAKALAIPLLLPIGPRIALGAFQFCQPFLLNSLLSFLQQASGEVSRNHGYGLIGATALIYTGIASSRAIYWYLQERALYTMRGALATAIYRKTIEAKLSAADDSAALTLMSADVERIIRGLLNINELWANTLEVAFASWLLSRQIGAAFVAPLIVVACCVLLSTFVSRLTGPRQKAWMEIIQKRVGLTSNIIGQMKHLKISGLVGPVEESIQQMRDDELRIGARFRMILTWSVIIGYSPLCISPVVTFAFAGRSLDVTTIFTTMSYLLLLANPLATLFQMIPGFNAAFTCLTRIQVFLEKESQVDFRTSTLNQNIGAPTTEGKDKSALPSPILTISEGNFGWEKDKMVLQDINIRIPASRLTVIIGPVASGKSTLCKVILGEAPIAQGKVIITSLLGKVGFCDQTPYLSNATIRENIIGFSAFEEARYQEVIRASMLTSDLAGLPRGDHTKVGSKGITLSGGQKSRVCIARALYIDSSFLVFDDILSGLDADTEEHVFNKVFSPTGLIRQKNATAILCTHSVRHLPSADHIVALGADGRVVEQGTFQELMSNQSGYVHSLGVKENKKESSGHSVSTTEDSDACGTQQPQILTSEMAVPSSKGDQGRILGDATVYRHYFSRVNPWNITAIVALSLGWGFFCNFSIIWLKFWSDDITSVHPSHDTSFYIGLYSLFQASTLLSLFGVCLVVLIATIQVSGSRIHKEALSTVINAPLKFFTTTDTGVVTNLFSQDLTLIDGSLPMALLNTSVVFAECIGVAAVIATSSPYLIITYPFLVATLWGIQKFYLRTSRQIRLLDLEAKSPLYTHFIDTMKGLATFRAFGWSSDGITLNNVLLDTSQRPAYLLAMIQRWLGFTLQLVVAGLALVFVTLATQLRSNTAFTGASLITLMSFGDQLSHLVESYTMLETSIGAVSRLKTFSDKVVSENLEQENVVPPRAWPLKGSIEINGVSASYDNVDLAGNLSEGSDTDRASSANLAIKNMRLTIAPGEKLAICGSSGSGKSSTILLLLKILDPLSSTAQNITIDSIPLHKIDRQILRQRIIAIPQDPVFLPDGTSFQENLDPYATTTESECRAVVETVGLWAFVEDRGGLASGMSSDTLSAGQKQLFSLARAILRARIRARERIIEFGEKGPGAAEGGILLLDEVSSSVDQDTDRAMQKIIREVFKAYTIVMVSHRLEMVMTFDTVAVMEKGEVVETGPPIELVEKEGGRFRELWLVGKKA
ncbi:P-loop containing nucleoside triphosphate hydrolase protein [Cadophora sp. MPI-SDFR-AT-0126]|nr:P-loop containing nucleoside triphosphate hydrolase protein [Leotiomycetes sp. MPI-SDFR-AT-0126]